MQTHQLCTIGLCTIGLLLLYVSSSFLRSLLIPRFSAQTLSAASEETPTTFEQFLRNASQEVTSSERVQPGITGAQTLGQSAQVTSASAQVTSASKHSTRASRIDCTGLHKKFTTYLNNAKIQKAKINKAHSWRSNVLAAIQRHPLPSGDVYEFGVYNGGSFVGLHTFLSRKIWGFDSFSGMPKESTKVDFQNNAWSQGMYRARNGIPECLRSFLGGPSEADMVKGYFKDSLTETLARERSMRPAAYVDVDVDLYSASYQALDWLFMSKLMQVGTLVGYDDWWTNSCSKGAPKALSPLVTSEGKAHWEIAKKYKVAFLCVAGSCEFRSSEAVNTIDWGPIFKIVSIGGTTAPAHGFIMSADQETLWKRANPTCRHEQVIHKITER